MTHDHSAHSGEAGAHSEHTCTNDCRPNLPQEVIDDLLADLRDKVSTATLHTFQMFSALSSEANRVALHTQIFKALIAIVLRNSMMPLIKMAIDTLDENTSEAETLAHMREIYLNEHTKNSYRFAMNMVLEHTFEYAETWVRGLHEERAASGASGASGASAKRSHNSE